MELKIEKDLRKQSIQRLNSTLKIILAIHFILFFTLDFYNYYNNVWDNFPSQYYVFLDHIFSAPVIIALIFLNIYALKKIDLLKSYNYDLLIIINIIAFLPFILIYYYWDIIDYNTSSVFIIYIFAFGIMLKFEKTRLKILTLFFTIVYFGMILFLEIPYTENPSLYTNGIAAIMVFYFLSRVIARISIENTTNEFLIQTKNEKLNLLHQNLETSISIVNKQNKSLAESNKNLVNFAYVAAHDIKSPIRSISNLSKILYSKYVPTMEEDDIIIQQNIVHACNDLSDIIDGILQFSKISTNEKLAFKEIDLNKLIDDVIFILQEKIVNKNIEIKIQDDIPTIYGVRELLLQLITNLLINSIKFSKEDAKIIIEIFYSHKDEDYITISIKDNGIGITKINQEVIFQLFKKLHNKNKYEGNGLGLAISKRIVENHKGEIWIDSNFENGALFNFTLKKFNNKNLN